MTTIRGAAICGLLLAIPLATAAAQQYAGRNDERFTTSARVRGGALVTVRNYNGPISVVAGSGDRVEIRAEKRAHSARERTTDVEFDLFESDEGVTVCTVYRGASACDRDGGYRGNMRVSVSYTIVLPANARLRAATGNGEVRVERAGSEVDIATGNGQVRIESASGSVRASTGNGDVTVDGANGPVRISTGNGRVFVSTASGPVNASTGNGEIDVRMESLERSGDMTFSSGSGTIRLTLPSDFEGEIDANTGNGSLRSDFAIQLQGRMDPKHVRGTIGRGGRTVKLRTGNGRLELRKG